MVQVKWVSPHVNQGHEAVDVLAHKGRLWHPNNVLPLSKQRRVTGWEALGRWQSDDWEVGSEVDSGGETSEAVSGSEGYVGGGGVQYRRQ